MISVLKIPKGEEEKKKPIHKPSSRSRGEEQKLEGDCAERGEFPKSVRRGAEMLGGAGSARAAVAGGVTVV